jgi:hypothetical protein
MGDTDMFSDMGLIAEIYQPQGRTKLDSPFKGAASGCLTGAPVSGPGNSE